MKSETAGTSQPDPDNRHNVEWTDHFFRQVPIDWLIVFRISFGAVMFWYAVKFLQSGAVKLFYTTPVAHFPYDAFRWVGQIDYPLMFNGQVYEFIYVEYLFLALCAFLIMIGLFYRLAAIGFALCFAHIFLIDKCYYQNHYYLVCLFGMLLPFLPANAAFSVDARLFPALKRTTVSRWTLYLVRFQVGVPYFFGGVAKISSDWLLGQPMRMSMLEKLDLPFVGGPWLAEEWCVQLVVWGGMLFDLFIVPALLWKRTRPLAYLLVLSFHLSNAFLWTIGIFPWLMILITTVFFVPDWPRRIWARLTRSKISLDATAEARIIAPAYRKVTLGLLGLFVTWQCLMPFRHFALTENPNWDEYAHHFSWHMLLRAKDCGLRIYATDPFTKRSGTVDLRLYLTSRQLSVVARDARMIHHLCHHIADDLESRGFPDIEIRALSLISLNGRKPQLMIDPTANLASVQLDYGYPKYLMPLKEPFRHQAWDYPLAEWEQHLELDLPPQMKLTPPARPSGNESTASSL